MRKTIILLLTLVVLVLSGCSQDGSKITDKRVAEDLQAYLDAVSTSEDAITIKSVENEQSTTEEKHFTARYQVVAEGKYLDYHYVVNVDYVLYDQGWDMDDCKWEYVSHNVARYPSDEEIEQLVKEAGLGDAELLEVKKESNSITCITKSTIDWSKYVDGYVQMESQWYCDYSTGRFSLVNQNKVDEAINANEKLEGTWNLAVGSGNISISQVTKEGFVVTINAANLKKENITVELSGSSYYPENGSIDLRFTGKDSKGSLRIDARFCDSLHEQMGVSYDVWMDIVYGNAVAFAYINSQE